MKLLLTPTILLLAACSGDPQTTQSQHKHKAYWASDAELDRRRDSFAAAALTGLISAEGGIMVETPAQVATTAYKYADAMLVAREAP